MNYEELLTYVKNNPDSPVANKLSRMEGLEFDESKSGDVTIPDFVNFFKEKNETLEKFLNRYSIFAFKKPGKNEHEYIIFDISDKDNPVLVPMAKSRLYFKRTYVPNQKVNASAVFDRIFDQEEGKVKKEFADSKITAHSAFRTFFRLVSERATDLSDDEIKKLYSKVTIQDVKQRISERKNQMKKTNKENVRLDHRVKNINYNELKKYVKKDEIGNLIDRIHELVKDKERLLSISNNIYSSLFVLKKKKESDKDFISRRKERQEKILKKFLQVDELPVKDENGINALASVVSDIFKYEVQMQFDLYKDNPGLTPPLSFLNKSQLNDFLNFVNEKEENLKFMVQALGADYNTGITTSDQKETDLEFAKSILNLLNHRSDIYPSSTFLSDMLSVRNSEDNKKSQPNMHQNVLKLLAKQINTAIEQGKAENINLRNIRKEMMMPLNAFIKNHHNENLLRNGKIKRMVQSSYIERILNDERNVNFYDDRKFISKFLNDISPWTLGKFCTSNMVISNLTKLIESEESLKESVPKIIEEILKGKEKAKLGNEVKKKELQEEEIKFTDNFVQYDAGVPSVKFDAEKRKIIEEAFKENIDITYFTDPDLSVPAMRFLLNAFRNFGNNPQTVLEALDHSTQNIPDENNVASILPEVMDRIKKVQEEKAKEKDFENIK